MNKPSKQKLVFNIIKQFAGRDRIVSYPMLFVEITGSHTTALFLSQLIFWSDKGKNLDGWIYKTDAEWKQELQLSQYHIRKATAYLKKQKLLQTKVKKVNGNPTLHYKLDVNACNAWFLQFLQERNCTGRKNLLYTEKTAEISGLQQYLARIAEHTFETNKQLDQQAQKPPYQTITQQEIATL